MTSMEASKTVAIEFPVASSAIETATPWKATSTDFELVLRRIGSKRKADGWCFYGCERSDRKGSASENRAELYMLEK